jgi:hypothetical protein
MSRSVWEAISHDRINKVGVILGYLCLRSSLLEANMFFNGVLHG